MYYFTLNGGRCACDTLAELQAVTSGKDDKEIDIGSLPKGGKRTYMTWIGSAGDDLNKLKERSGRGLEVMQSNYVPSQKRGRRGAVKRLSAIVDGIASGPKVSRRKKKRAPSSNPVKTDRPVAEIKRLPLVKGPITWAVTDRYAKKLKRDDVAQLRSDLRQRQKLES